MASNWPTQAHEHAHMRMRAAQNSKTALASRAENWMLLKLKATGLKWRRQAQSGYRLFDFWSTRLGIAVEVDGPEHDHPADLRRDHQLYQQRGIVILRVRNFHEGDARAALMAIQVAESWNTRRAALGLTPVTGGDRG